MKQCLLYIVLGLFVSVGAQSDETTDKVRTLAPKIKQWLASEIVVKSTLEQNKRHESLEQAAIDDLDKQWRAQTTSAQQPLIEKTLSNELSTYLKTVTEASEGLYSEVFVMDNKGLNVGQSEVTSDYWQGDESKWQKTFLVGADAIHVSEVEFDESTQVYQCQISLPIIDPATNQVIGAVTVGVNVDEI